MDVQVPARGWWKRLAPSLGAWLCVALGMAQPAAAAVDEAAVNKAFEAARSAAKAGPADVAVAGQGHLKLPAGHVYIPQPQAADLLNAMGNPGRDPRLQGLVFPQGDAGWFMTLRYEPSGYIKDDDAKAWDVDELLDGYRKGTEDANAERQKMGVPAIEILGWAERPRYDGATHQLVWAMSSRHKGAPAGEAQGVNYNTYVLGREGYFSLNLVTGLTELPAHKPAAQLMLQALSFDEGKRYADFNASTDRVAEYGLAALVVGAAAKKFGLLAMLGVFFAKFAKLIFIGLAVVGGLAVKLFKRPKPAPVVVSVQQVPPPGP